MKNKLIISLITLVLIAACVLCAGCTQAKETYVVSVDPALQPFSVVNEDGSVEGFDVDMMKWIAKDQNININIVVTSHNDYLEKANDGIYDIRPGVIITEARKETLGFSDPYMESHYSVVARKDSDVTMDNVLSGEKIISVSVNSAYVTWLKNYYGEEKYNKLVDSGKVLIGRTVDQSVYAVLAGDADAVICGDIVSVTQCDYYAPLKFVGYLDGTIYSGIATAKGDTKLQEILNKGIADFRASPEYNELKQKYSMPYFKSTYKVGIDSANKPFTYLDENGNLTGIDYDSIMWIADKNGFNVEFVEGDWSSNINSVYRKEIDMWYSGMTITPERLNWVTFSNPYLEGGIVVFCPTSNIITKNQFESGNAVIGAQLGTTNEDWLISFFGKNRYKSMVNDGKIILVTSQKDMYDIMNNGRVDCVVVDEVGYKLIAADKGLTVVSSYDDDGDYGVAMKDGNIVLIDMINKGISEMKSTGYYDTLLEKYNLN